MLPLIPIQPPVSSVMIDYSKDKNIFSDILKDDLGFLESHIKVLVDEGYDCISTLSYWKYGHIRSWCELKAKVNLNRGGITFGDRKIKSLQVLYWWVTDMALRGRNIFKNEFNELTLEESIEEAKLDYEESTKEITIDKPKKFRHDKWV